MSSKYSQAAIDQVRRWYLKDGKSDAEIGKLLSGQEYGEVTRNAVIGLRQRARPPIVRDENLNRQNVSRLNTARARQASDAGRSTKPAPPAARPTPPPIQRPAPPPPPVTPAPPPYKTKVSLASRTGPTLFELGPNQCRNPVGPEATHERPQMFCGERTGTREVEIRKGVFEDRVDSYCPSCAARNRVGTSSAASLIRANRAYA